MVVFPQPECPENIQALGLPNFLICLRIRFTRLSCPIRSSNDRSRGIHFGRPIETRLTRRFSTLLRPISLRSPTSFPTARNRYRDSVPNLSEQFKTRSTGLFFMGSFKEGF